jgi:hypothetical protein
MPTSYLSESHGKPLHLFSVAEDDVGIVAALDDFRRPHKVLEARVALEAGEGHGSAASLDGAVVVEVVHAELRVPGAKAFEVELSARQHFQLDAGVLQRDVSRYSNDWLFL